MLFVFQITAQMHTNALHISVTLTKKATATASIRSLPRGWDVLGLRRKMYVFPKLFFFIVGSHPQQSASSKLLHTSKVPCHYFGPSFLVNHRLLSAVMQAYYRFNAIQ